MKTAQEWIEQLLLKPVPTWDGPKVSKEDIESIQRDAFDRVEFQQPNTTSATESVSEQIKRGIIPRRADGSVCEP